MLYVRLQFRTNLSAHNNTYNLHNIIQNTLPTYLKWRKQKHNEYIYQHNNFYQHINY